jgi:riboflavin kinase/FMN adenylyltransferase
MGNFDGMHLGHTALIRMAVSGAKRSGLRSAVFTFSSHPKNSLAGGRIIRNIQYLEEKAAMIESLGVDYLFSLPFTEAIHHMSPDGFIRELLTERFNMAEACCGFNFRFGYKAEGSARTLMEAGGRQGFPVHVLEALKVGGEVVSSSIIRARIAEGRMEEAAAFLGRGYRVGGEVVEGNRIGRTIGFPTLNILMDESMVVPAHGVYVTSCLFDGKAFAGVSNVGVRPTIGDEKKSIETHLFDFDQDIYGRMIRVEFIKKIRDERRFKSVNQLAEQIAADSRIARAHHGLEAT